MRVLLGVVVLASAAAAGAQGTGSDPLAPTPVAVQVTADDSLREAVSKCLADGLARTLGAVVAEDPLAFTLDVIAVEQTTTDGSPFGYLVYAGGYLPGPTRAESSDTEEGRAVVIRWQSLRSHPPDLDSVCHAIVEGFVTEVLAPARAELERIREMHR